MSEVLERPVSRSQDAFELEGKTVEEVARYIEDSLRATELEPEWVFVANRSMYANEAVFGRKPWSKWPAAGENKRRCCVSIERGQSEGWIVRLDTVWLGAALGVGHWRTQPLIRIKTLTRSHGWAVAAVVSNLLNID
ncbi:MULTISPECIES: hypothetical protein [unclassified Burkholderia]|uniref:hypothetical protein n=1 Tax=unclassified Burkholderia TaxID=2613784 RepID=UPI000758B502|nr:MULTISPECIES: hypothetical protein [unclassified Burkholderia]KUY49072.1 hypothetical protein WS45_03650 [Burkholderia sp. RF2-non_BP3]KUY85885.1 hypothetical protein WS46_05255 [Burkholderia sp. RF4-BP95]KUY92757.1 hypothetical protein WS49_26400 [Burkholderia sp. RF7-non_BP4]KUY95266.1 hypothetical protein WS48_17995 [Burkholderia sp. RF7-non_BP1]